jgi:SLT domain-containing protein/phage-related protein
MATITSLGFNITAKWDGTGLRAAQAQLDALKKTLDSIDGDNLRVAVDVDDASAVSKLEAFNAQLDRIAATHASATVNANVNSANVEAFQADLNRIAATRATATANANVNSANVDAFQAELNRVAATHATATASVNTNSASLTALEAELARFGAMHETATATVNTNSGSLDALRAQLALFGASRYTATADVNTDSAHLHMLNLGHDVDNSVHSLGTLVGAAGGAGQAMGGMGSAAGGAGSSLGGLSNAAGAGGSAFGSLGTAIVVASVAMAAFTALAPLAAASIALIPLAFVGVAATLISTNDKIKKSFTDTFQTTLKTVLPLAMPVINALLDALKQMNQWLQVIGPAIRAAFSAAAPLVQPMLDVVEKLVGAALPGLTAAMRNMGPLFDGIGQGALKFGSYLGMAAETLSRIPGLGQAMNAIMGAAGQVLLQLAQTIAQVVSADHGQLMVQLLQAISVWLQALTPIIIANGYMWTGLAVIMRGVGDVLIAIEAGFRAFFQLLQGSGPIMTGLTIAWNATVNGMKTTWTVVSAALVVAWNATWNAMSIAARAIWTGLQIAWSAFINAMALVWTTVSTALVIAWNAVWNGMSIAARAIWTGLQIAWSAFITAMTVVWNTVGAALSIAWNATWNAMSLAARTIWAALQVAWSAFITAMATTWTVVSAALSAAWNAVWNAMSTAARAIWAALQVAWSAFITAMATTWNVVSAGLSAAWNAVWNAMAAAARAIWTALQAAWTAFINAMTSIWNAASAALQSTWSAAWNGMKTVATTIWNALTAAWQACVTTLTNLTSSSVTAISNLWETAWNHIKNVASTIWNWLTDTWHSIVTTLTNFTSSSVTAISNLWETAWNHIKNVANTIWNWLSDAWHSTVTTLTNFTSSSVTTISNLWETAWNHIKNVATTVWNGLKSAFGSFKDWMISTTKTMVSGISNAWDNIQDAFKKPVHFVISTVINGGIIKAANWVIDKLGGGGSTIPNVPVPFATGGYVSGPGTGTSDSIPARLSNGEYVLNADAVSKIGVNNLHEMNRTGSLGAMGGFSGMVDPVRQPQLAAAIAGYGGGLADGGLADSDLLSLFESAIKAAGGAAADMLSTLLGGAAETAGDVAGDIVGAIGGIFGHPHAGDSLKGHGDDVAGAIQGAFSMLEDAAMGGITDKVFDLIADKLLSGIAGTSGPLGAMGLGFGKTAGKALLSGVIKDAFKTFLTTQKQQAAAVYAASVAGSKSVQAWAPLVVKALAMEGLPMSWLPKILSMMQQESGGNPNAVNNWDSNAAAGTPSMGLMQTIAPTFSAYHWPGTSNNILDPLANIAAALNYIKHVYGYPPGSPYASGTTNATPGVHLVGENGPEMVLFGGGETVKNAADTSAILGGSTAGGSLPAVSSGAATSDKQLADSLAAWQDYMAQIQTISDAAWQDVATTAAANWSDMQTNSAPFVTGMTKTFTDGGNAISDASKASWDSINTAATTSWDTQSTTATLFNTNLQKQFADSGTAIQTKWASDLASGTAATQESFSAQSDAANAFGADIQQIYADTSTSIQTTWKNALDSSSADAASYITDTKGSFSTVAGTLQSAFVQPVSDLLTTALPAAFATSVNNIGTAWNDLKTTVREPVAAVVDVVFNKGIVAMWNAIAGTFDAPTLDSFTMPAYAMGGEVSGPGTGTSDSITARLSNGEHVWTAAEVRAAGGHANVAAMRSAALGGTSVRMMGAAVSGARFAAGGGIDTTPVGAPQGGTSSTQGQTTGNPLTDAANAALGSIKDIANPFITAAGDAGKASVDSLLPGNSSYKTLLDNMVDQMVGTVTGWITANDVAPTIGGVNDAAAQAWADAQVGKPYALGGNFGVTFDCSQYMSGIARAILGETPAPWFTTFAFSGDTAPSGFERELEAPFMIGITNVGVGHTAGTLNGTNYEATPPAVRSGPSARGYNDPMFQDWYGFRPSIEAVVGGVVTDANHKSLIDTALAAVGVPPPGTLADWESGMDLIVTNESGWNANAINNWDSNAAAGIPSQGLAQVIPPTFSAYHVAGTSDNILDPIANLAAAINYIVHVYGNIDNVPGVANVRAGGGYLPYYGGTRGAQRGWHTVGERGPEWVNFKGGEEVYPNGVTPPEWGHGGGGDINIENHFHGPVTKEALQYAEGPFSEKLRQACKAGVGKRGRH